MGKKSKEKDPAARLAELASGQFYEDEDEGEEELSPEEQAFVADLNFVLETVAKRCENNVWDMQALLAAAGEELRLQIREMAEGD